MVFESLNFGVFCYAEIIIEVLNMYYDMIFVLGHASQILRTI